MICAVFLLGFKQLKYIVSFKKYFLKLKGERVHLLCWKYTVLSHLGELGSDLGILTQFSTSSVLSLAPWFLHQIYGQVNKK